ncbi:alcohol dehydrogenase catalytic domain-containing protein [Streptomyces sp. SCSIO 30461]|uniref:alcohol dehydrogenase catalytic domain-containing protein n=1 Tax=Streptomyces sp. SCSIO 30461 TaxID=3118085 RepID=UPI0030D4A230
MKAALIEAPGRVVLATVPDPAPGPREVVVGVAATGLCGTDLHILQGGFAPALPVTPGHEFAGEIVAVGREVIGLAVDDRVAVDPSPRCHECRSGRGNLCERRQAIGVTAPAGAAEFAVAPAASCLRLPEHVDVADAVLIEPLSCAIRGYDVLSDSTLGAEVLIYGSGTMGLMMLELAKPTGAASVDVLDVNPSRLATAAELGCSRSAARADDLDKPDGWDFVIDATGNSQAPTATSSTTSAPPPSRPIRSSTTSTASARCTPAARPPWSTAPRPRSWPPHAPQRPNPHSRLTLLSGRCEAPTTPAPSTCSDNCASSRTS